jgi:hypothetical protein
MTRIELRERLIGLGIPGNVYELNGSMRDECYVLDENYGTWVVYYSEKGLRTSEREFTSESDACEYMLRRLRRDFAV